MLKVFQKDEPSKDVAKDRLKMVLISDRINCNDEVIEMIRRDVIIILSKYLDVDEASFELHITSTERNGITKPMLNANIPINNIKNRASF